MCQHCTCKNILKTSGIVKNERPFLEVETGELYQKGLDIVDKIQSDDVIQNLNQVQKLNLRKTNLEMEDEFYSRN